MSKESDPTSRHNGKSASSQHVPKRGKIFNLFRSSNSESKVKQSQSTKATLHHLSTASAECDVDIVHAVSTTEVKNLAPNAQPSALPTAPRLNIFLKNISPPVGPVSLPEIGSRFDTTPQLALCLGLISNGIDIAGQQEDPSQVLSSDALARLAWLDAMKQDPVEQERLRWLGVRMANEFAKDSTKDSTEIAEMALIGPVLDNEHYRRLLSCTITAFDQAVLLDVDLLQGLVQLVQSAPSESLLPDDLVKILRVLRVRLQNTHQQSSEHPFHLTLAVSRLLDVMAEHKVKDLDRVEDHEPLSGVLSSLKASSDPYLMYQACYAFQALQYVPNNESPLQAVLRHSTRVVGGLVKVSAVFKLDLGAVLDGLGELQEALVGVAGVAGTVYDGACSVLESGRGVLESLKEGLGSGQKRLWYTAIRAAYALAQAGQLADLSVLIYEAPCRRDPLFQWGICQLLGEIATDDIWDTSIRLQAVALLGELYRNDPLWGQDDSVKNWMLNIIRQLCASTHQAVSNNALALLKDLNQDQGTTTHLPYPLRNRLPLPASSPTLARVLAIPDVEFDLHKLRLQRLEDHRRGVYIHPQAKPSLQASDDKLFPLMEKVLEFMTSQRQVFLVLGDSGAGKSTFNLELEQALWKTYEKQGPIPIHVSLPTIDNPAQDLIEKQLQYLNFSEDQIREMKLHRQFILICDGYDESQLKVNIHTSNQFNRPGQWNVKMVISCRTQYLGQDYRSRFQPQAVDRYQSVATDLFQEAVVAAFSKAQIQQYVEEYVKELPTVDPLQGRPSWTVDEYMDKLSGIPNLMDLVSNPFLLTLALDALPSVVESKKDLSTIKITRVQLYDSFVKRWLEVNRVRLEASPLSDDERTELDLLIEDNFLYHGIHYQKDLASAIFIDHPGSPFVKYTHLREKNTWKAAFFSPSGQAKLLREASTVMRSGIFFRFLHRSLLEYFYSRTIYDPLDLDADNDELDERDPGPDFMTCLSRINIVEESSIVQFLAERVGQDLSFRQQLHDAIEQSKTDSSAAIAASNAITILVKAGVTFHGADLRGIKVPDADLSNGQFDSAQLQGADLTNASLSRSWLRQADLSHAQLESVRFGELPYLKLKTSVQDCAYSPDGKMLGVVSWADGLGIQVYDTSTWQRIHLATATERVASLAFSPDSQRIVSGGESGVVRLWDCTSGEELLVMKGHKGFVRSLAYSPCDNRIASAGDDKTARLWDSETGICVSVLEGHTDQVYSVIFSPDGRQLLSGSRDGTIRFWNSGTGEAGVILSPLFGMIFGLACSPDGRWVVSSHDDGKVRLWDMVSGSPGPVLQGHTARAMSVAFSPNGQLIASASSDRKVMLWDASTGDILSVFDGHLDYIWKVTFSPDSQTIASGSGDKTLRLWEVNSSRSSIAIQDQIGGAHQVAYSRDGLSILSVNRHRRTIQQGDATTGARGSLSFEIPNPARIHSLAFSSDGTWLATGCEDGSVRLWDCRTGAAGLVLEGHLSIVRSVAYSTCDRWIASSDDGVVRLWDLHDTEQRYVLLDTGGVYGHYINALKISPTGHQLAVCSEDGMVWLFDPQTRVLLTSKKLSEKSIMALDYLPDGQQLALRTLRTIALWDLQSDEPSFELNVPVSLLVCFGDSLTIASSPCGQFLASSSADYTVHLWRRQSVEGVETWTCAFALKVFQTYVTNISWNPVVPMEFTTASEDGSVRVWRVSSDDGEVAVKMLWGTNLGRLCTAGIVLEGATGLSLAHQKLISQRRAFDFGSYSQDD